MHFTLPHAAYPYLDRISILVQVRTMFNKTAATGKGNGTNHSKHWIGRVFLLLVSPSTQQDGCAQLDKGAILEFLRVPTVQVAHVHDHLQHIAVQVLRSGKGNRRHKSDRSFLVWVSFFSHHMHMLEAKEFLSEQFRLDEKERERPFSVRVAELKTIATALPR